MAVYTYPLTLAEFAGDIRMSQVAFTLDDPASVSRSGGGAIIKHRLGERLWYGTIDLVPARHVGQVKIEALISVLQEAGASFLVYDARTTGPAYDPNGSILGASTPSVLAIPSSQELRLQGLPVGYEVTPGDMISVTYGSNPLRYTLHRAVQGVTAGGAGQTTAFQVIPPVPSGVAASDPVELIKAPCKAKLVSAEYGSGRPVISEGARLQWRQTFR